MKVSHRHQVHVQLTGREASMLANVFEEFGESSRMERLSDEQVVLINRLRDELELTELEDANVAE